MIQTSGLTTVQGVNDFTKTTPAIGDIGSVASNALVDILADGTAVDWQTLRTRLGIYYELPVDNTLNLFHLQGIVQRD